MNGENLIISVKAIGMHVDCLGVFHLPRVLAVDIF